MKLLAHLIVIGCISVCVSKMMDPQAKRAKDSSNSKGSEGHTIASNKDSTMQGKRTGHFLSDYFGYGAGYYGNGYGVYGYPYSYPPYYDYGSTGEFASTCGNSYPNRRYSCYGLGR